MCVCVRACVRACVRVCACVCVRARACVCTERVERESITKSKHVLYWKSFTFYSKFSPLRVLSRSARSAGPIPTKRNSYKNVRELYISESLQPTGRP